MWSGRKSDPVKTVQPDRQRRPCISIESPATQRFIVTFVLKALDAHLSVDITRINGHDVTPIEVVDYIGQCSRLVAIGGTCASKIVILGLIAQARSCRGKGYQRNMKVGYLDGNRA